MAAPTTTSLSLSGYLAQRAREYKPPNTLQDQYNKKLFKACQTQDEIEVGYYLDVKQANPNICNEFRITPMHFVASSNKPELFNLLVKHGAKIDIYDYYGRTPLHLAIHTHSLAIIELLIEKGANIHAPHLGYGGLPPIMLAAMSGNKKTVKIFVKKNVSPNTKDHEENTLLHAAALSKNPELTTYLLKKGLDPTAKNQAEETPLDLAKRYRNDKVITLLERQLPLPDSPE